jgi:penicillin-binding protein 1B
VKGAAAFMLKKIRLCLSALIITAVILIGVYSWFLSSTVSERFSSRRWSMPSKVYSDTMILYTGQRLDITLFLEKLKRIGYRERNTLPARPGEIQITPNRLHIFLHDLETPRDKRAGFLATVKFSVDHILSMTRMDDGEALAIIEIDPEEIALFFGHERERRLLVSFEQIPQYFIHAVLAAEDARFYQHRGIDPYGILRALVTNLRHGSIRQGGSTITQQLAKNYFLTPNRNLKRKFQEMMLAFIMELKFSKNEILEIYLNEIYLGQKGSVAINGVGEAARFYFGKSLQDLSLSEAAVIAGLIKAPNTYSPYVNAKACHARKNMVLNAMVQKGWLANTDYLSEREKYVEPVGYTHYGKMAPYFIDYLSQQLMALYQPDDLSTMGLSIYTTLDPQVQMAAEKALQNGLERLEKSLPALKRTEPNAKLQGAIVVLQPKTGHILAMVGGRNYDDSQFNRITQARRQPGSAFKPFVFFTGLDLFTPISLLSNQPKTYKVDGKEWQPKNFQKNTQQRVTVRYAIENSHNLATIDLAVQVGLAPIIEAARTFGFSTPLKPYPSLALGAFEVIPLELARAYGIFAAEGVSAHPLALKAVVDEDGDLLDQRHLAIEQTITSQKAFMMNALLRGVVENGTARSLVASGVHWPVAGKTGTTNEERDAWFIGYTPDILALVWVGFDNGDSIHATGSSAALPIWLELMMSIPHHISGNQFREPPGIVKRPICGDAGNPVVSNRCSNPYEEYFLHENAPKAPLGHNKGVGFIKKVFDGITTIFKEH